MKKKEQEIKIEDLGIVKLSEEEDKLIREKIEQAEKELDSKTKPLTLRIPLSEIERCKRIAKKKGLPYQTYIKSILKQALDKEESA